MYEKYGLFIDGKWGAGNRNDKILVSSPVSEKPLGALSCASDLDTRLAIDSAEGGFQKLSLMTGFERADALHKVADEMSKRREEAAEINSRETGKPIAQAMREWVLATEQFRWYAEEARRIYGRIIQSRTPGGRFEVLREPVGIVGAFTAWNFPASLPARKIAPALAAGCSVVLRPSSQTPGVAMVLVDCIQASGLPAGAINLVVGDVKSTYDVVMSDCRVRKVSLTGSTQVGQKMIRDAASTVKKVSMELGGNAPLIVYDDADLNLAIEMSVLTKFSNAGQVCVTADRFFIHEQFYDEFIEKFVERTRKIKLGDGLDPAVDMGPLINSQRLKDVEAIVREALDSGATLAHGGVKAAGFDQGHFFEPTVLTNVKDEMRVFSEENFGPIAAITSFSEEEEVLERANNSNMGLAAYAFTKSADRAARTVKALKAGMVGINSFALAASEAPFGGTNYSGMGREGGSEGIEDYLEVKLAQLVF